MNLKKAAGKVHLLLGLASGLLVLFLGLTGCILAFEREIRSVTEPYQFVKPQDRPFLPPSSLKPIAENVFAGLPVKALEYPGSGKAAVASYYDDENYKLVYLNPYTGEVLNYKNMNRDFFRIVLDGHFYLWLPPTVGQPIVASGTLIFLIMMITGIILWWPRSKSARKQRFTIKLNVRWRRRNYDLHNVLGFYMSWVAVFLAFTGLVWGFQWFAKSVYWISSGGSPMPAHVHPESDLRFRGMSQFIPADKIWNDLMLKATANESVSIYFPASSAEPLEGAINHRPGTYYDTEYFHYDQYTAKELPATGIYAGSFSNARFADKLHRMNYDIHVGAVLGLPGKILAFCGSLIAASLPISGFLIWWGRRRRKRAPAKAIQRERLDLLILEKSDI